MVSIMASGDLVQVIFPNTAGIHTFTPAVGVNVILTVFGNRSATWGGYANATYPVSGTLQDVFNGANTNTSPMWKMPVSNTTFFTVQGSVSRYIAIGGIEI